MVDADKRFQFILIKRIGVTQKLRRDLAQVIAHKIGSTWGHEQLDLIMGSFVKLKMLDGEWQTLESSTAPFVADEKSKKLVDIFQRELLKVKEMLTVYETQLTGARALVEGEIKQITKSKKIRGYHQNRHIRDRASFQIC